MQSDTADIKTAKLSYRLYGDVVRPLIVIETALGNCSAEWWHLADKWSEKFSVLLYDRAGYGTSSSSSLPRTPDDIAAELNALLQTLGLEKPAILIGHSLGGLLAQYFTRKFPKQVRALILLDPVSVNNYQLKEKLTKREYSQSGIDKSVNFKMGLTISSLKLGFLLKPMFKKAPPFYYYPEFSREAETYILNHLTQRKMYKSALAEYACIESPEQMKTLNMTSPFPAIPLFLICHDPAVMTAEIEQYGGADEATAAKVDELWLASMKEYLAFSTQATFQQAAHSGHFIHLSNPDIVWETICKIDQ